MAKTSKMKPKAPIKAAGADASNKTNPFDQRANKRIRHPALNRKVKGAYRNVAQARTKAQLKRESDISAKMAKRKSVTEIIDRRFGEADGGEKLSHEEKMLRRFQTVRTKKRSSKFQLGEEDDQNESDDEGLTHQGRSLAEVLDEEGVIEEESEDDEDVEALIARLKRGETFNAVSSDPKKHLTKKEAMMDVVKKSKMLKMERQREKEVDQEERERLDNLMQEVVQSGSVVFRPTGAEREKQEIKERAQPMDPYEKLVRELQMDSNPRAKATERTKKPEEIANEEMKELERLEAERLRRLEGGDDDEEPSDEEGDKPRGADRRKRSRLSTDAELPTDIDDAKVGDLPFIIECPKSHAELLELLKAYPTTTLDTVITRIRKSTSIHLKAENRARLAKFCDILIEHLILLGERTGQVLRDSSFIASSAGENWRGVISSQLHDLGKDVGRELASSFANRLETMRRTLEAQLSKAKQELRMGGDLGSDQREFHKSSGKKMPGGHKEGLADSLNIELSRLKELRGEEDLAYSTTRCWFGAGDLVFLASCELVFSASDQRHVITSAAALLIGMALAECPIRGPRDVCAAVDAATILASLISRREKNANRFAPEVLLLIRVILGQLSTESNMPTASDALPLISLDSVDHRIAHSAFNFMRSIKELNSVTPKARLSYFMPADLSKAQLEALGSLVFSRLKILIDNTVDEISIMPSADAMIEAIIRNVRKVPQLQEIVGKLDAIARRCKTSRSYLKLQDFAPEDKSVAPRFLTEGLTAKRPGDSTRVLKRELKRERKGVARELRLDGQFASESRAKEKFQELQQARAVRQSNFRDLEGQQSHFNRLVKEGIAVKGAGVGGLSFKGHKKGNKKLPVA